MVGTAHPTKTRISAYRGASFLLLDRDPRRAFLESVIETRNHVLHRRGRDEPTFGGGGVSFFEGDDRMIAGDVFDPLTGVDAADRSDRAATSD